MNNQDNKDDELREQIQELLKYGLAPTPVGAVEQGGSYLDAILSLIQKDRQQRDERAVKYTVAEFLKMNIENPRAPVNIDEVKRRAIVALGQLNGGKK